MVVTAMALRSLALMPPGGQGGYQVRGEERGRRITRYGG
jgi:hypothetical protein